MPVIESSVVVPLPQELAFAVSQTTGEVQLRWDPFISNQHYLDGAPTAGKGVRTKTRSWHRLDMVPEYVRGTSTVASPASRRAVVTPSSWKRHAR